jgi:hypothetical protein
MSHSALHGPAHAGNFRVQVGRYRDRFYVDPLPGCTIAPSDLDWSAPSVSWTKPPFANRYVTMKAIADMPSEEWARLAGVTADARYEAIKSHDKLSGRVNMDRGSIVHQWAEDLLLGRTALFAEPNRWADGALQAAEPFRPALDAFFDAYQPEAFAVEAVCLHRTLNDVGYGGTMDALVKIDGELWCIDWKSRHSDHAAYLEEAAQGGAYIGADYMIVAGENGEAQRVAIPDVAGVLIVSIRADGYRAFPIDADRAIAAYADMHAWAVANKMSHNDIVGKPWGPRNGATPTLTPEPKDDPPGIDRRATLRGRFGLLPDDAKAEFKARNIAADDLDAIEEALNDLDPFSAKNTAAARAETAAVVAAVKTVTPPERVVVTPPDEGGPGDVSAFRILESRFMALSEVGRSWIGGIARDALVAGMPFGAGDTKTVRRFEIYRGLITLAERGHDDPAEDGELVRSLVATAVGSDDPYMPMFTVGHVVGAMSADEAATFARLCSSLCDDVTSVDIRQRPAA